MAASQKFVTANTPMGATLVEGGATFRVWAPRAAHVYVARGETSAYQAAPEDELVRDPSTGHWTGFFPVSSTGRPTATTSSARTGRRR
jgi:1,4-alpha-glucan branching enzyme